MKIKHATLIKEVRIHTGSFVSHIALGQPPIYDIWCDGNWMWIEKIRGAGAGAIVGVPRENIAAITPLDASDVKRITKPAAAEPIADVAAAVPAVDVIVEEDDEPTPQARQAARRGGVR